MRDILSQYLQDKHGLTIDELDERGEFADLLLEFLTQWNLVTVDASPEEANLIIWKVFGDPFFLQHERLTEDQDRLLLTYCEEITLSIPRIHKPEAPMENGFYMLWDMVIIDLPLTYEILERLIWDSDLRIQVAAIHGLGHQGEKRIPFLLRYIDANPDMWSPWFEECLAGEVM